MCASTLCPLSNSTRNIALGNDSVIVPSSSIAPSFLPISSAFTRCADCCFRSTGPDETRQKPEKPRICQRTNGEAPHQPAESTGPDLFLIIAPPSPASAGPRAGWAPPSYWPTYWVTVTVNFLTVPAPPPGGVATNLRTAWPGASALMYQVVVPATPTAPDGAGAW